MPEEGVTMDCPLCKETGDHGIWTWTRRRTTAAGVGPGGLLQEPGWLEQWECSLNSQHNRQKHEPL